MVVRVLLFSHVRQALGETELEIEIAEGTTVDTAAEGLRRRAAGALDGVPLAFAVNQVYVNGSHALADGDELALIPPVQGG